MSKKRTRSMKTIGWREWVALPALHDARIKAKVDTGARSSSLHAFEIERFRRDGVAMVRFLIHPLQRSTKETISAEAELLDVRKVKSSGGHETVRPVILTEVDLLGERWPIELTLAGRDAMGFRMLLGRQAVRDRFLIDPGKSFLAGQPPRPPRVRRPKPQGKQT